MYLATESWAAVQARGRWQSLRTMQIYIQELVATAFFSGLPKATQSTAISLVRMTPRIFDEALQMLKESAPAADWRRRMEKVGASDDAGAPHGGAPGGAVGWLGKICLAPAPTTRSGTCCTTGVPTSGVPSGLRAHRCA